MKKRLKKKNPHGAAESPRRSKRKKRDEDKAGGNKGEKEDDEEECEGEASEKEGGSKVQNPRAAESPVENRGEEKGASVREDSVDDDEEYEGEKENRGSSRNVPSKREKKGEAEFQILSHHGKRKTKYVEVTKYYVSYDGETFWVKAQDVGNYAGLLDVAEEYKSKNNLRDSFDVRDVEKDEKFLLLERKEENSVAILKYAKMKVCSLASFMSTWFVDGMGRPLTPRFNGKNGVRLNGNWFVFDLKSRSFCMWDKQSKLFSSILLASDRPKDATVIERYGHCCAQKHVVFCLKFHGNQVEVDIAGEPCVTEMKRKKACMPYIFPAYLNTFFGADLSNVKNTLWARFGPHVPTDLRSGGKDRDYNTPLDHKRFFKFVERLPLLEKNPGLKTSILKSLNYLTSPRVVPYNIFDLNIDAMYSLLNTEKCVLTPDIDQLLDSYSGIAFGTHDLAEVEETEILLKILCPGVKVADQFASFLGTVSKNGKMGNCNNWDLPILEKIPAAVVVMPFFLSGMPCTIVLKYDEHMASVYVLSSKNHATAMAMYKDMFKSKQMVEIAKGDPAKLAIRNLFVKAEWTAIDISAGKSMATMLMYVVDISLGGDGDRAKYCVDLFPEYLKTYAVLPWIVAKLHT